MGLTEREIGLWKHCLDRFFSDQELNSMAKEIKMKVDGFRRGKIPKSLLITQLSKEVNLAKIKAEMTFYLESYSLINGIEEIDDLSEDEVLAIEENDKLKGVILYKLLHYDEAEGDFLEALLAESDSPLVKTDEPKIEVQEDYQVLKLENQDLTKEIQRLNKEISAHGVQEKKMQKEIAVLKKEIEQCQSKLQKSFNQIGLQNKEIYYYREDSKRFTQQLEQLEEAEKAVNELKEKHEILEAKYEASLADLAVHTKEKVIIIGTKQKGYCEIIENQKKYQLAFIDMGEKLVDFTNDYFDEVKRIIVIKPILHMDMLLFIEEKLDEMQLDGRNCQVIYVDNMSHLKNILK